MSPNLEMQVNKTQVGLWRVTYGHKEAPLDVQEAAFALNNLGIVSPAQLGFLRAQEGKGTFNPYSRTNADVFYDDRHNHVIVVPNGAISGLVGIANLVDAHGQGKECVIPKNQRELVYAMADGMLRKGTAFYASHGQTDVETSKFGEDELASRLFSDERLGIKAQDYGNFMKAKGRKSQLFFLDSEEYAKSQKGPYANRLLVFGLDDGFDVDGNGRNFVDYFGAFGVRFEKTAEGSTKKG